MLFDDRFGFFGVISGHFVGFCFLGLEFGLNIEFSMFLKWEFMVALIWMVGLIFYLWNQELVPESGLGGFGFLDGLVETCFRREMKMALRLCLVGDRETWLKSCRSGNGSFLGNVKLLYPLLKKIYKLFNNRRRWQGKKCGCYDHFWKENKKCGCCYHFWKGDSGRSIFIFLKRMDRILCVMAPCHFIYKNCGNLFL